MKFTKMHGLQNDFVVVDDPGQKVADLSALARAVCDRRTGVGADGLILILPSKKAHYRMAIFNADGSRAQMCGNGIRCVAKYLVDRKVAESPEVQIETDAGIMVAQCRVADGMVQAVRVDMGVASLESVDLPTTIPSKQVINHALSIKEGDPQGEVDEVVITCVSMGNPHAVVFVDDLDSIDLAWIGPRIERAPEFPERINAHFVRIDSPTNVTMKTWERGCGVTSACGTGASAVCVAGAVTQRTQRMIVASLPGGDLLIEWAEDDHVYMTGPAIEVFTGEWLG